MAFTLALKVLSKFSLRFQYRVADFVSLLISVVPNRTAKLIDQNIRLCFPELDSKGHRKLRRDTIKHSCYSAIELAAIWCWPVDKVLATTVDAKLCDSFAASQKAASSSCHTSVTGKYSFSGWPRKATSFAFINRRSIHRPISSYSRLEVEMVRPCSRSMPAV